MFRLVPSVPFKRKKLFASDVNSETTNGESKKISLDELDRLGINDQNNLYWDGTLLKTEERLVLNRWVNVAVIVSGASTLTVAIIELLKFLGCGVH